MNSAILLTFEVEIRIIVFQAQAQTILFANLQLRTCMRPVRNKKLVVRKRKREQAAAVRLHGH